MSETNHVIVIGAGAAGMLAAIAAAREGAAVELWEQNEKPGKKLFITGKGRCNVTNDCDRETLLASIPGNGRFLYGALTRFTPRDTMAFFEALGVPLTFVEQDGFALLDAMLGVDSTQRPEGDWAEPEETEYFQYNPSRS